MMIENIFIFRNHNEIEFAINKWNLSEKNNLIVPWNIEATDILIEKKIPYTIPSKFLSSLISEELYIDRLKSFKQIIKILDQIVNKYYIKSFDGHITLFSNLVYKIRRRYFKYFDDIDILNYLIGLNPKNINLFYIKKNHQDNYLIELIEDFNIKNNTKLNIKKYKLENIRFEEEVDKFLPHANEFSIMGNTLFKNFYNYLILKIKFSLNISHYKYSLWDLYPSLFKIDSKKNNFNILVLLAIGEELPPLIKQLKENGKINLIFWENLIPKDKLNYVPPLHSIKKDINENNDLLEIMNYKNFNYFKFFINQIITPILKNNLLSDLIENKINFEKLHNNIGIDLVLTSNEFPICEEIFNSCERYSIPRIDFLHGGTVGFSLTATILNEYFRYGGNKHYKFVYTDEIINFQQKFKDIFNINQTYISVGSYKYRAMNKKKFKRNNLIKKINLLYIVGPINNNSLFGKGMKDDIRHFEFMNNMIENLKNIKSINLFIKMGYEVDEKIPNLLNRVKKYENIHLIFGKKIAPEYYNKMDLLVLDSISTSLFEAASTNIPILLFNDNSDLVNDKFISLLEKRAKIINSEEDFNKAILEFSKTSKDELYENRMKNISYDMYYEYCNSKDIEDGKIALKKINQIIGF